MLFKWLILLSIGIVIFGIVELLGIPETVAQKIFMIPGGLYFLWTIPPSLAVTVRRLHDTNRSGLWIFLKLIDIFTVILGSFILFVFLVQDSQPGRNRFGRNPKKYGIDFCCIKNYSLLDFSLYLLHGDRHIPG